MTPDEARARFAAARVARLATVSEDGRPHLVPVCFALEGDTIFSAVDAKPKRTRALRRLRNVAARPDVSLLVDEYDDGDWSALWWARADGTASVAWDGNPHAAALLSGRYGQYRAEPPTGPVLIVRVTRWSGWSATARSCPKPPREPSP